MSGDRVGQASGSSRLASDSGMLHPDSRGQSYPNVAGRHPAAPSSPILFRRISEHTILSPVESPFSIRVT
jgi:hypothetical protein